MLLLGIYAAHDQQTPQLRVAILLQCLGIRADDLMGLPSQLSGGAHDQAQRALSSGEGQTHLLLQRHQHHGQPKHQCLARACEGDANHVPSGQCHGQTLHLDGRGLCDALAVQLSQDASWQLHLPEVGDRCGHIFAVNNDTELVTNLLTLLVRHEAVLESGFPASHHALVIQYTLRDLAGCHERSLHDLGLQNLCLLLILFSFCTLLVSLWLLPGTPGCHHQQ
mmetsp:Transcript_11533/g.20473  ORF Transcript_11533/g.20473 Transcript_11533/m.20473 type:complete len:223 (-) Transcript_11533:395-1063(-)